MILGWPNLWAHYLFKAKSNEARVLQNSLAKYIILGHQRAK